MDISEKNIEKKKKIKTQKKKVDDSPKKPEIPWVDKYRPKKIDEVLSQDHITSTIKKLIQGNKLPHLLFYGKPGTGKTSSIIAIAKEIFGDSYQKSIMELNASDDRGIGVVRDSIKVFASTKTLFGNGFKLIILDEADHMTREAQTALRRIIEQYTKNTRFCLICNYVNKIIPALRSRCTQFRFSPLKKEFVVQRIKEIAELEGVELTQDGLDSVIRLGKGDMRRCLYLMQSTHASFDVVNEKNVYTCAGQPTRVEMRDIVEALFNKSFLQAYKFISTKKKDRGLSIQDIIDNIYLYILSLELNDGIKAYLVKNLSDIEYNSSFVDDEKLQLSALIGIFQIAKHSIVQKKNIDDVIDDFDK